MDSQLNSLLVSTNKIIKNYCETHIISLFFPANYLSYIWERDTIVFFLILFLFKINFLSFYSKIIFKK